MRKSLKNTHCSVFGDTVRGFHSITLLCSSVAWRCSLLERLLGTEDEEEEEKAWLLWSALEEQRFCFGREGGREARMPKIADDDAAVIGVPI